MCGYKDKNTKGVKDGGITISENEIETDKTFDI